LRAGKPVPRTTKQLWNSTQALGRHELRVGDLLFFRIEGKMSHVGLYLGKRRFVHAPSSGRTVAVASLDSPYYQKAFLRGGRLR
jgi:cell wall-associated NlpC family hydrolase